MNFFPHSLRVYFNIQVHNNDSIVVFMWNLCGLTGHNMRYKIWFLNKNIAV